MDINRAKTVYGYDRINPNLDEYIKYNIKNNKLEKNYEKKKPSTNISSQSASTKRIPSQKGDVNTNTNIYEYCKKYMDNNKEIKANVQSLLKIYNKSEIDEEALADVLGQLFGNQ